MKKIISSLVVATFIFTGCGDEKTKETPKVEAVKQEVKVEPKVVVEEPKKVVETKVSAETVAPIVQKTVSKGEELFRACAGCHGAKADRSALGVSNVVKGWSKEKIETALKGYKDSTYGGSMKNVMKGQVSKLSDEDISILAEHISNFK